MSARLQSRSHLRRRMAGLALALAAGTPGLVGCLELETPTEILPREAAFPTPGPDAPLVVFSIAGEAADRDDWARAVTISRFFASRVENRTGTLRELLTPAVEEALRRRGYRSAAVAGDGAGPAGEVDRRLEIALEAAEILWLPPQEFIQTPTPRRDGRVRLRFRIETRLNAPDAADVAAGAPAGPLFEREWNAEREVPVTPGRQSEVMGELTAETLRAYALFLANELPPAF